MVHHDDWDGPWKLVSVATDELDSELSPWYREKSKSGICVIGRFHNDFCEVAIDPVYLPSLKFRQFKMNLDYNPTHLGESHDVGTTNPIREIRDEWLRHAAHVIRSGYRLEIEQAFFNHARSNGLHEELARAILVHDIQVSLGL